MLWKLTAGSYIRGSPWVNQILHRVDSLICTSKTGNHLRSHLRAITALDHRKLIKPGKKIRPNFFLRSTSLLYKMLPTNLGACKPTFYTSPFINHLWGETVLWGTVFIIQTSDRMRYFTILQYKLHAFNIQDDRSTKILIVRYKNTTYFIWILKKRNLRLWSFENY